MSTNFWDEFLGNFSKLILFSQFLSKITIYLPTLLRINVKLDSALIG